MISSSPGKNLGNDARGDQKFAELKSAVKKYELDIVCLYVQSYIKLGCELEQLHLKLTATIRNKAAIEQVGKAVAFVWYQSGPQGEFFVDSDPTATIVHDNQDAVKEVGRQNQRHRFAEQVEQRHEEECIEWEFSTT